MDRNSAISEVKGIGAKTEELFHKLGVYTVGDILLHYPRTYVRFPETKQVNEAAEGETAAVMGRILTQPVVRKTKSMLITTAKIGAAGVDMELVWFRMPYLKNQLKPGSTYVFYGKTCKKGSRLGMEQPAVYRLEQYAGMERAFLPVYGLTGGISNNQLTKTIRTVLSEEHLFWDYLPAEIRERYRLCEYNYAVRQVHFPDDMDTLTNARRRLVFDEFFLFILQMRYQKERRIRDANLFEWSRDSFAETLIEKLPYQLTGAQRRALDEIRRDMRGEFVMQRLVQGDVGSGKTILAFLAMADASHNDYQSAIMAPTEVLARQHYDTFRTLTEEFGLKIPVVLLTGAMTAKQKRMAYEALQLYPNAMIVGTHALIQERAVYDNLALVITDEQHRFGVHQREALAEKGKSPHILVMSATPIPRTLAIILYGDLHISVVDELPADRLPIKNCVVNTSYRPRAYKFIAGQVKEGRQAYVVCPQVEEGELEELENVVDYAEKLKGALPADIQVAYLHGKMRPADKNRIMEEFAAHTIDVLVSTTVIEVGINVPNATVMMVENAERFGLAQLHQLRGRVGRGEHQSYCIFVSAQEKPETMERLEVLNHSNDGFYIASEDLKLRGPGDLFGIRQSGAFSFRMGDIYTDASVLAQASAALDKLLTSDPGLNCPEHGKLRRHLEETAANQVDFRTI